MSDKIYFQWQNETLQRTIYPLREMKLRDFLIHFQEIDIWAIYRGQKIEDLSDDVAEFKRSQTAAVTSLQAEYDQALSYFQSNWIDADEASLVAASPEIVAKLKLEHASFARYFLDYDKASRQKIYLDRYAKRLEDLLKLSVNGEIERLERNLRNVPQSSHVAEWKQSIALLQNTLPIINGEINRLYAFLKVYRELQSQKDELEKWIANKQRERTKIDNDLRWKRTFVENYPTATKTPQFEQEIQQGEAQIEKINQDIESGLASSIEERLKAQIQRQSVSVNDIARWKSEQYQESLEKLDHQQLLETIVQKFLDMPTRFPLWLQYMVIHFSGMRYRSAHGSWGDPKDLLLSLRIKDIDGEIKKMSDEEVLKACIQEAGKLRMLDPEDDNGGLDSHIDRLESQNPYRRRRALLDFRVDQEKIRLEKATEDEIMAALETLKDHIPDWMWSEIVARTQLRLKFATSVNWEELTAEQRSEYLDRESAVFREIMIKWKQKNLTGWREEHDRENRLIVTRAVCNEVAEHIQHLRGLSPFGGLTAKPVWYLNNEKADAAKDVADKSYFIKPSVAGDFKVGASILWLRWVKDYPNPWRIAHPITLANGDGLLDADFLKGSALNLHKTVAKSIRKEKGNTSDWMYEAKSDAFRRKRIRIDEVEVNPNQQKKGKKQTRLVPVEQTEWLRWMHEATVAEVAETADGPVVLTFETALPYDDPRRSTIGVFRRSARDLRYFMSGKSFNGTFVGYVPESDLPIEDLHDMLDWNHILLKDDFVSPEAMKEYWEQVTPKPKKVDNA